MQILIKKIYYFSFVTEQPVFSCRSCLMYTGRIS